jgi:hypothetical protein
MFFAFDADVFQVFAGVFGKKVGEQSVIAFTKKTIKKEFEVSV